MSLQGEHTKYFSRAKYATVGQNQLERVIRKREATFGEAAIWLRAAAAMDARMGLHNGDP